MARNSRKPTAEHPSITTPVVTDATAPVLLGMSPRQFREAVTRQGIPSMKLGQRTVVFLEDLRVLARQTATLAHPEPRDRYNQRLAAATKADDFWASVEHLDERDTVNAVLAQVGRQMTDEAYRNYYKDRGPRAPRDRRP